MGKSRLNKKFLMWAQSPHSFPSKYFEKKNFNVIQTKQQSSQTFSIEKGNLKSDSIQFVFGWTFATCNNLFCKEKILKIIKDRLSMSKGR